MATIVETQIGRCERCSWISSAVKIEPISVKRSKVLKSCHFALHFPYDSLVTSQQNFKSYGPSRSPVWSCFFGFFSQFLMFPRLLVLFWAPFWYLFSSFVGHCCCISGFVPFGVWKSVVFSLLWLCVCCWEFWFCCWNSTCERSEYLLYRTVYL